MDFKININKIHSDLTSNYDSVSVLEKSSLELGEYLEITTTNEGKDLIMLITKRDLNSNMFSWKYFSNPKKKDYLIERRSSIDNVINDVKDIFTNNRFDSEYVNNI